MAQPSNARKARPFNYKIGGVSARYYVALSALLFAVYLVLPLPASYYRGDTFYIVAFIVLGAVSAVTGVVSRLRWRWRQSR
jgi:hypothetical protein